MIEREVIVGVERGDSPVSALEIRQMAGRCGRGYGRHGEVTCLVRRGMESYAEKCLYGNPEPVRSGLKHDMLFHLLPHVISQGEMDADGMTRWHARSLSHVQGDGIPDWDSLMDEWRLTGCVRTDDGVMRATPLGVLSNRYYVRPEAAMTMRDKLETYKGQKDLTVLSWMLANVRIPIDGDEHPDYDEYVSETNGRGLHFDLGESLEAFAIYRTMQPSRPRWIRHLTESLKREIPRRLGLLGEIADLEGIELPMDLWRLQLERRVPVELYPLLEHFPDASVPLLTELDSLNVRGDGFEECDLRYASNHLKQYLHGRFKTKKSEGDS